MKTIVALTLVFLALLVYAAILFDWHKPEPIWAPSERIKLKADITINEHGYKIIEVDSVEYLVTSSGVCPLARQLH